MSLPSSLAKKVKELASRHILNLKALINGRGFSKFKKQYRLTDELGQGGFGVVYRAVRIADDLPVAVKFIERRHVRDWGKIEDERIPMEICMLAKCAKVEGVIRLIDWFAMPEGFLIIMERPAQCIDLFDFIHNQHQLDEELARFLFRQVVKTMIDCFSYRVLHRDLKDENIVIDLLSGSTRLIDFGAATTLKKTRYHDFQGTRLYCPPEWFLHSLYLGREATVWSMGVLLFNMLNGRLPFHNEKDICTAHLLGPLPYFTKLSAESRSLVEKCLCFDPFMRPSLEELLRHPWLQMPSPSWAQLNATRQFLPRSVVGLVVVEKEVAFDEREAVMASIKMKRKQPIREESSAYHDDESSRTESGVGSGGSYTQTGRESSILGVRRNAKTSLMHNPYVEGQHLLGDPTNKAAETGRIHISGCGSFDSGTSSALQSPVGASPTHPNHQQPAFAFNV